MLDTRRLKIIDSQETPIVPGEVINAEGIPLVRTIVNGREHVRMANSEVAPFIGFSYTESLTPVIKSRVELLIVNPDNGEVTLMAAPISGQIAVFNAVTGVMLTVSTDYSVSGTNDKVLVFGDAYKGKEVRVQYRYVPTVAEVLVEDRVLVPSLSSSDMTGSIGVILQGIVYTDYFDASKDFSDNSKFLCVDSNGLVSIQDAENTPNACIPGRVISVPGIDSPFLGIRLR